jgi:hypothetical protein
MHNLTVGYKVEGTREFFETRVLSTGLLEPSLNLTLPGYDDMVMRTFVALTSLGSMAIGSLCNHFCIDPRCLLDLVDEHLPPSAPISSSVLRICSYPSTASEEVAFGSHTDTSFVTVGIR